MHITAKRLITALTLATLIACGSPPPAGSVTSVTIDGGDRTTVLGDALTLTATVVTTGGAPSAVTWSSSDESVATVAAHGQVTSLADGSTDVTATSVADASKSDTIVVTVTVAATVTSVTIDGGDRTIVLGDTPTLTATVVTIGGAPSAVTWSSSDESVATVAADGQVTGLTDGTTTITATSTVDPTKNDAITLTVDPLGVLRWTRQFGTSSSDIARGVATDANGDVYTTGTTEGALEGSGAGNTDSFVRSYDRSGTVRWTRQFGTSSFDVATGIATDANDNVYTTGYTSGDLEGISAGGADAFVHSYDSDGDLRWTRQFGTGGSDLASGIATDVDGNVYTTGTTTGALEGGSAGSADAFVRSYDGIGDLRWTRQFGTSGYDETTGIATDTDGNVYVSGYTVGALEGANAGNSDAFVRSYDNDGNVRWTRQFGTSSNDVATGIAVDTDGNVYTAGLTSGALEGVGAGDDDAFVRSYDSDGNHRWTRQFGTSGVDRPFGIATDAHGNTYVSGFTNGALEGSGAGDDDAFVRSYDSDGDLRWTRQFGTSSSDVANGLASDAHGTTYVVGSTTGALEGSNAGDTDVFIRAHGR